jgi:CheY-like chemotaxis protein
MALILTVTHDLAARSLMARFLPPHNLFTASSVGVGARWLERSEELPDLIIADVGLRSFQGREFVEALKRSVRWKDVPVLLQTKSVECGEFPQCEGMLVKPFSCRELIDIVCILLRASYLPVGSTALSISAEGDAASPRVTERRVMLNPWVKG